MRATCAWPARFESAAADRQAVPPGRWPARADRLPRARRPASDRWEGRVRRGAPGRCV